MFDSEVLYHEVGIELVARRGLEFTTELFQQIMGVPGRESMRIVKDALGMPESPDELYEESQAMLRRKIDAGLALMPGLTDLLNRLEARGLPLGVATSTERDLTDLMLARAELRRRFRFVLTRNDVDRGKPDPEIYLRACQFLALAPADVAVIEDSYNGTLAAAAAGCQCIAIPHPLSKSFDFSHADLVADHLLDPRLLARLGLE